MVVLCGVGFYVYKTNDVNETYENNEIKNDSNMLSMMLETSAGSGEYQESTASSWPTKGYIFNENISKCERGSKLTWDDSKKTVIMSGNEGDKCYVYFDKKEKIVYLADYVKSQYTTQGANNLYLHDIYLSNGAKDNSYRYAGSSDTTNNFVCFGYDSQDGSCPNDNLYRIIGAFDGEVKLIKYDYAKSTLLGTDGDYNGSYSSGGTNKGQNSKTEIGGYYWNYSNGSSSTNDWTLSRLNTINLNKNYINNIGTKWSEKISDHTWKVGGNTWMNIGSQSAPTAYQNEINSPATNKMVNAKVGLMYVSDYGYAASFSSWSTNLSSYQNVTANNWMYMGLYEWTLAPRTGASSTVFGVRYDGYVGDKGNGTYSSFDVYDAPYGVRPVFYLKSTIGYGGGSGTAAKPILLS
ncbi:hypothetical protein EGR52_12345 [bacterium]|nr:hypothetical protein [bacterium]